jgi:hypothetical protein
MGTSRSGSVGSSPQWKQTRDDLEDLVKAMAELAGPPRSIRIPGKGVGGGGGKISVGGEGHTRDVLVGPPRSIDVRSVGRRLIQAHRTDPRFLPLLGDCAVRVALDELFALSAAATLRHRTQRDAPKLFQEYGVNTEKNVGLGLSKALDERFRKHLVEKCGNITDNTEKARRAMQQALIEMLSADGGPDALLKMSANQIHDALRKTNAMDVVRQFYRNYIFNTIEVLVSSSHADISPVAEQAVLRQMRTVYCDEVAEQLVRRARSKGWRPGEIPEKVDEWRDLLVEEEEAHV